MEVTKNTFDKALDTYTDEQLIEPRFYTEAHNITLTSGRKFFGPTNIQGTLALTTSSGTITNLADAHLKTVFAKFKIDDVPDVSCLVHFIAGMTTISSDHVMHITCQRLSDNQIFYLYTATYPDDDYFTDDRLFDTRVYPENGIDYIYFTDFFNEIRQLRCEIPTGASANFLTDYDLSMQRRGANGTVTLVDIISGGSLLSGTYQYAYRMADPASKKYTKWSSLCQPIHVYNANNSTAPVYSSVGLPTNFSIQVRVTPSPEEAAHFTHYQLAVVENIYGVTTQTQPAALLPIKAFSAPSEDFTHDANQKVGLIPITDIVVDLAAIKTAKTLAIKQNRMFAGNIQYHSLEFESDPVATGSIIQSTPSEQDPYSNHVLSSTKLGYFRDEVYRFGIIYKDKYGNRSPVKVLDLNGITDNQIAGTLTDVRFPDRSFNGYSLFTNSTNTGILGLDLVIINHPEWAVGFEIVKAKRKKRILFQTPVIPMTYIEGIGALGGYPSKAHTDSGDTDYPSAQPQKQSRIYTPKNLLWPELRGIVRRPADNIATGADFAGVGEAALQVIDPNLQPTYSVIFPPSSIFSATPYAFTKSEQVDIIDYALTRSWVTNFNTVSSYQDGDHIDTQISANFYALRGRDYYFDAASGGSGKTIPDTPTHIKDAAYVENVSTGLVMGGNKIMVYNDLSGQGVNWGTEQQPQRCVVIETSKVIPDLITNTNTGGTAGTGALSFSSGTLNEYTGVVDPITPTTPYIVGTSGPFYEYRDGLTNAYISDYSGWGNAVSNVQAFKIANIILDLDDDRYGSVDTQHEFVSTGATYTFSSAELITVQAGGVVNAAVEIFGGDCFIAAHTFKVCDTWYAVTNQGKSGNPATADSNSVLIDKWGRYYNNAGSTTALCIPVPLEGASTFVEFLLESEYNGGVMGEDITWAVTTINDYPVMNLNDDFNTSAALRSPLLYPYNNNLSKQNDQKVYFPLPEFSNIQHAYKARVAYSDLKIYESDVQGFDVFRVGNIYDLEESRGAITKLAIAADDLYAIQRSGTLYLPTGQNQLQQTDAGILAVGTGDVISRPIVLQQARGGQHLRGIVETGDTIFVPDSLNQTVYKIVDKQIKVIDLANDIFVETTAEYNVVGLYDALSYEYLLSDTQNNTCFVYNEFVENGTWIGNYEFNDEVSTLKDGVWCNNRLYLMSLGANKIDSWAMYEGSMNRLFGKTVTPRLTFVVNPNADLAKTYDDMLFVSDQRLDTVSVTVPRETSLGDQTATMNLDALAVEGGYRIKTLRDTDDARLRGSRMLATVEWKTGVDDIATLSSVLTKYRLSSRTPF